MYTATHRRTGTVVHLSEEDARAYQSHPATRGLYGGFTEVAGQDDVSEIQTLADGADDTVTGADEGGRSVEGGSPAAVTPAAPTEADTSTKDTPAAAKAAAKSAAKRSRTKTKK